MLKKLAKKSNKKGFTLIELIVVIAILGILAAILIPTITGIVGTARKNAEKSDCQTAYMAAQLAYQQLEASATDITTDAVQTGAEKYAKGIILETVTLTNSGTEAAPDYTGVDSVKIMTNGYEITYTPGNATSTNPEAAYVTLK